MAEVTSLDRFLEASFGANRGRPKDVNGNLLPTSLGAGGFFTSKWYDKSQAVQKVIAQLYTGSATNGADLTIEESWANVRDPLFSGNLVIWSTTVASATKVLPTNGGSAIHVAQLTVRVVAPHYRIVVKNTGAGAWTVAELWAKTSDL